MTRYEKAFVQNLATEMEEEWARLREVAPAKEEKLMKYIIKTGRVEGKFQMKVFKEVETVEFTNEADAKCARGMLFRTLKDAGHEVERMSITAAQPEPQATR